MRAEEIKDSKRHSEKEVSDGIRSDSEAIKVIIYVFIQSIKSVMR